MIAETMVMCVMIMVSTMIDVWMLTPQSGRE